MDKSLNQVSLWSKDPFAGQFVVRQVEAGGQARQYSIGDYLELTLRASPYTQLDPLYVIKGTIYIPCVHFPVNIQFSSECNSFESEFIKSQGWIADFWKTHLIPDVVHTIRALRCVDTLRPKHKAFYTDEIGDFLPSRFERVKQS